MVIWKFFNSNGKVDFFVKKLNDLPIHLDRVRDENGLPKESRKFFSNRCLAIPGFSINENWASGVQCRTQFVQIVLGDDKVLESPFYMLTANSSSEERLL